jgi:hypothetical protein
VDIDSDDKHSVSFGKQDGTETEALQMGLSQDVSSSETD